MSVSIEVITGATVDVDGTDVTVTVQSGQPGVGLPAGGSTGQVLSKASAAAYDFAWISAGGSVTSVTAGTGLTGGTITGSGTIAADFGKAAGKVCEGNDARLSDARTPTSHTHTQSEVTGLLTALSAKVPQTRLVNTGNGITGGGDLTGNLQLDLDYAASGTSSSTKPVRADDSRLSDSRAPNGSAGGDLTGTYPNPTIGNAKVTTAKIDDGAVTLGKVVAPTAGSKLLGSSNPDTGAFKEITIGTGLSMSGSTLNSTSSGATPSVNDFTSSGTYTVPSGATWLFITCIGGGGGGGAGFQAAAGNLRAGGGGGGGGAITILRYAVADLSGNYGLTITVGGAGGGGAGSGSGLGNNGTGGGASSVSVTATSKQIAYAQGGTAANRGSATAGGSGGGAATVGTFSAGSGATGGTTAQVGAPGAPAMGAPGGGGGGGVTDTNAGFSGGNGRPGSASTDGTSNSGGGASGATGTNGSTVGTSIGAVVGGSGSGGGGGTTNAGGNGGAGDRGGGGGGGGGGTTAGGSGGSGGAGFVRIEVI